MTSFKRKIKSRSATVRTRIPVQHEVPATYIQEPEHHQEPVRQRRKSPTLKARLSNAMKYAAPAIVFIVVGSQAAKLIPSGEKAAASTTSNECVNIINEDARLSGADAVKLASLPERSPKEGVEELVGEFYCDLESLEVRAGVESTRQMIPLEKDNTKSVIVMFEGETFVGMELSEKE